ncbi:MAG: radical SAM protein [Tissierellia bacterium]|nr:radical SAM protein [Tissierellia bacterium]
MKIHSNIPIFISHQGCHYNCVYCNQRLITGKAELPNKAQIKRTIEVYLSTLEDAIPKEIAFFGGSFTALTKEEQSFYLDIARSYVGQHGIEGIRFSTRPDAIDEEEMAFLSDYPISTIELGVQSLDTSVLRASGRGHGIVDVLRAVNLVRQKEIALGLQMMTGLPEDHYDAAIFTAEKIISLKPAFVRIYPTLVLKGTPLENMMNKGFYTPWNLEETVEICSDILSLFMGAQIPVIRLGLYSSEKSFLDSIVAGPYHPALRGLVMGRLYQKALKKIVGPWEIEIHPKELSYLLGHGKENVIYFEQRGISLVYTLNDTVPRGGFLQGGHFVPIH